jgi:hypothetical protein
MAILIEINCVCTTYCLTDPVDYAWCRIKAIIILTLLPVVSEVKKAPIGCFELYGFGRLRVMRV